MVPRIPAAYETVQNTPGFFEMVCQNMVHRCNEAGGSTSKSSCELIGKINTIKNNAQNV
jgi:hypothetical protein